MNFPRSRFRQLSAGLGLTALLFTTSLHAQVGVNQVPSGRAASSTANLPRFSIDFPGGTPAELIALISKASGSPVNAIIPDEYANTRLPKLKLTDVNAPDVFQALELASRKVLIIGSPGSGQSHLNTSIGFRPGNGGPPENTVIWYFRCEGCDQAKPSPIPTIIQVYSLTRFLGKPDQGLHSVEDITTAIHTGWKMQQIDPMPELSYHKETQLLIAVGPAQQLMLIEQVLRQLEPPSTAPAQSKSK